MSAPAAILAEREGHVLWLTLNRAEKRNALDGLLVAALKSELAEADRHEDLHVVALRGAGKDFCAGADLASLQRIAAGTVLDNLEDADSLGDLFLTIRRCRKPVVALVHGRALAGGCGLATACDLVFAAESAVLGYPEVQLGFVPAMVMAILRRSVSEKVAFELVTLGRPIGARQALAYGLVNGVFPDSDFDRAGRAVAEELASRSSSAVQLCKRLLYQQDGMMLEAAVRRGAEVNVIARMTEDSRAGIASFLARHAEKR